MLNAFHARFAGIWITFLAATGLAGCFPTSEHPVLVDGQSRVDSNLLGVWYGAFDEDDDRFYLHIVEADSDREETIPGGVDILMVQHPDDEDNENGWGIAYAVAAEVSGQHFLSVDYRVDNGEPVDEDMRGLHLFYYDPSTEGRFTLHTINDDALETFITTGALSGIVEPGMFGSSRLTSSSADLAAFLETADIGSLFEEDFGVFERRIAP